MMLTRLVLGSVGAAWRCAAVERGLSVRQQRGGAVPVEIAGNAIRVEAQTGAAAGAEAHGAEVGGVVVCP